MLSWLFCIMSTTNKKTNTKTNLGGFMANLQKQLEEALKEGNLMKIAYIRREMSKLKMEKQGGKK